MRAVRSRFTMVMAIGAWLCATPWASAATCTAGAPNTWQQCSPTLTNRWVPSSYTDCRPTATTGNPQGRSFSGSAYGQDPQGNGHIFYWGGGHNSYPGNDVDLYDIANNQWVPDPVQPQCLASCCGTTGAWSGNSTCDNFPLNCPAGSANCMGGSCGVRNGGGVVKPAFRCAGGTQAGLQCSQDADCTGGGTCSVGIPTPGQVCPTCRPYTEHSYQRQAYNPVRGKFLMIGTVSGTWEWDPATREFSRLGDSPPTGGDQSNRIMLWDPGDPAKPVDPQHPRPRMIVLITGGPSSGAYEFNYITNRWSQFALAASFPTNNWVEPFGFWDGHANKFILSLGNSRWFVYDPGLTSAAAWNEITLAAPDALKAAYCPGNKGICMGGTQSGSSCTSDGDCTGGGTCDKTTSKSFPCFTSGITYDARNQRTMIMTQDRDSSTGSKRLTLWGYDILGNSWYKVPTSGGAGAVPGSGYSNQLHYDPKTASLYLVDLSNMWQWDVGGTVRTWSIMVDLANVAPTPTLGLAASPAAIQFPATTSTLRWAGTSLDTAIPCTASGGWSGPKTSGGGSEVVGPLGSVTDFTLTCTATNGTLLTKTVTVSPPCAVSLAAGSTTLPATASTANPVNFTATPAGCNWTATVPSGSFMTPVPTNGTGTGNAQTLNYNVTANAGVASRVSTLTLNGQPYTVTQAGAAPLPSCTYAVAPLSVSGVSAAGETKTIVVTASPTPCTGSWIATNNTSSVLTINSGGAGMGSGTVTYTVAPNPTTASRSGTLTIAGQTVSIGQLAGQGVPPGVTVIPANTWTRLNPSNEVITSGFAGAVWDSVHGVVLHYGGGDAGWWGNEVTRYDPVLNTWTQDYTPEAIATYEGPYPGASCSTNADCPGTTVPFNSCAATCRSCLVGTPAADWNAITPLGRPWTAHINNMLDFVPRTGLMYMHGGIMGKRCLHGVDTTWSYDPAATSWTNLTSAYTPRGVGDPDAHIDGAMAYDSDTDQFVVFGGIPNFGGALHTTWVMNPTTHVWTQKLPAQAPPTNDAMSMRYDPIRHRMVLFGGWSGGTTYNQTWAYNVAANTWTNVNATNPPSPRGGHGFVYDSNHDVFILWGGKTFAGVTNNETWIYDPVANAWSQLLTSTAPPSNGNTRSTMVYDPVHDRVIVPVGANYVNPDQPVVTNDTHTWAFRYQPKALTTSLTLSALPTSVASGGSTTLTWSGTNLTFCTASGGWAGTQATSGSQSVGPLTATTSFRLDCTGTDGTTISQSAPVTVTVTAPPCTIVLAAPGTTLPSTASSGNALSFTATPAGCTWSATVPTNSFITPASTSGTGTGSSQTLTYSITANTGTASRVSTLTLNGQPYTVTQSHPPATPPCAYTVAPLSVSGVLAGGETKSVTVTPSASTCTWTATSNASFLTINSGTPGIGNGTVSYTVAANTGTATRSATITITDQTVPTVTQTVNVSQLAMTATPLTVAITTPNAGTVAGMVTLTASVTGGSGAIQVRLLLKPSGGQPQSLGNMLTTAPYTLAWDTTTVSDGTYELSASAQDAGGAPVSAAAVSVTVNNTSSNAVPTNLRQTARLANQIDLAWDAPVGITGLAGYRLYQDGQFLMRTSSPTFSVIGLTPNTSYAFSVEAYDTSNTIFGRSAPLTESTLTSRVFHVGPTRTLKKISDAAAAAQNGDTIEIDAGNYYYDNAIAAWRANNLTIRGVGGRPHIDAHARSIDSRGVWAVYGKNTVIENVELSGGHDTPGAGIRLDTAGGGLVVRNCSIHDNDDGILGGNKTTDIIIEHSEFYNNGDGTGQTHNNYLTARALIFRHNYSHGAVIGHQLKSRSLENYVLYNRFMDEQVGSASVEVELPCGGPSYVIGNLIQKSPYADSSNFVKYAAELGAAGCPAPAPTQELYVVNNTLVNDYGASGQFVWVRNTPLVKLLNNLFIGGGTVFASSPAGATATQLGNLATSTPLLVDQSNYDYHLLPGSPAINQGVNAGMANGVDLTAVAQYRHAAQGEPRSVNGVLDLGAYEFDGTVTTAPFDVALMNLDPGIIINPGGIGGSATVIVARTSGSAIQPVTFAVTTPAPLNAVVTSVTPTQCDLAPACAVTVTAAAPTGTPTNTFYSLVVSATSGGLTKTLSVPLSIYSTTSRPVAFDHTPGVSPSELNLAPGSTATATVTTALSGTPLPFSSITASGLPSGVTAAFSASTCTATNCTWTLTFTASALAKPTPLPAVAIITASAVKPDNSHLAKTTMLLVNITGTAAGFDYILSSSGGISVAPGSASSSTITASRISGSAQAVAFSASGLPSGATVQFSPPSCSATCTTTLTVQTVAATPSGTVTVTGTSGSLSHTIDVPLTVTTTPTGLLGDLDASGLVDVLDLQQMVNVLLGTQTTPAIVTRADLNGDGNPTILDLQQLVNLLLRS